MLDLLVTVETGSKVKSRRPCLARDDPGPVLEINVVHVNLSYPSHQSHEPWTDAVQFNLGPSDVRSKGPAIVMINVGRVAE